VDLVPMNRDSAHPTPLRRAAQGLLEPHDAPTMILAIVPTAERLRQAAHRIAATLKS
jgi:hypothetical protein